MMLIPLVLAVSIIAFAIIELPPGDYVSRYISDLEMQGKRLSEEDVTRMRASYGMDKPIVERYFSWIGNILLHGEFGRSFQYNEPVKNLIGERIGMTLILSAITMVFTYVVAITIGIFSAVRPNTFFDYVFTLVGFIGIGVSCGVDGGGSDEGFFVI